MQDAWFHWVTDMGSPGPDRGLGGKYLIVPPGYDGELPDGGYFIAHAKTNGILWFGRSFLKDGSDPKPSVDVIKSYTKVYPFEPGGVGTSIASFLAGKARLGKITEPPATVFHEGSGKVMNTLPPNDWSYFELLNEVVQSEPATALDVELMGPIAALGIVKGKPFAPDERMKRIMTDAVAVANAASRNLFMNPRDADWFYYPGLVLVQHALRERLRIRDADSRDHAARRQAVPADRLPADGRAHGLLLRRYRHHAGDGHAIDRGRLAVPH